MKGWNRKFGGLQSLVGRIVFGAIALVASTAGYAQAMCERNLTADVVALDMPLMWNRLGAQNINGMMYALKRDVVRLNTDGTVTPLNELAAGEMADLKAALAAGGSSNVALRPDKRPRPLVLRTGEGDCLTITLTNLLATPANPFQLPNKDPDSGCTVDATTASTVERSGIPFNCHNDDQVAERRVSLRFQGAELVGGIHSEGSYVGKNADATIGPGESTEYTIYTPHDGANLGVSYGGTVGGEGQGGQTASGLWAVLNVNPRGAAFYRSTLTNEELQLATACFDGAVQVDRDAFGNCPMGSAPGATEDGQPILDYEATYPNAEPWISEGKAGLPIVNMVQNNEIVHTAIDAIVAYGPNFVLDTPTTGGYSAEAGYQNFLGHFPDSIYPLESVGKRNPTVPNRLEPFREFTVAFHDETQTTQVFPKWYNDPVLGHTLHGVRDSFMINYGSGGIGSEIIANRLGVGPMHDCVNCAYEEFFLTFHAVGEVGQLVDIPANVGLENCDPTLANCGAVGPKANYVLYPDDPSNVHHSYVGDNTAFRNLHAGPGEQHVFHLHNHQWLFNANDDNSNYLDAQGLGPGAGYGYWINFGGSGNRNKTAGDAIFHCHFYPHFAQGMWEMWRIHDAYEPGTELMVTELGGGVHTSFAVDGLGLGDGTPATGARALPDGEIVVGAPTPSVVPLPGKALPPMPADGVTVVANHNEVEACFADLGTDIDGNQVLGAQQLREAGSGNCPVGTVAALRPVGSLSKVDRAEVFGADGALGGGDDKTPGYPFWIAGMEHTIGSRPPTPPLDMITGAQGAALKASGGPLWQHVGWNDPNAIDGWDGGLPRFAAEGYSAGGEAIVAISRLDMSKEIHAIKPVFFPEEGTDLEQVAMAYHAQRCHDTNRIVVDENGKLVVIPADCHDDPNASTPGMTIGLTPMDAAGNPMTHGGFLTNGSLPIGGAPFQDPCIDDRGVSVGGDEGWFFSGKSTRPIWDTQEMQTRGVSPFTAATPRVYKGANVQFDAVLNKLGYHFPQQRIIALWQDVVPTITQERPPEPFVLRMNTFDCTAYVHGNVVPKAYELDDYQVRTPTDIIGQHIHLPKWDLTSADGSANGWNYEDGTLSPEAVVELIEAINTWVDHHGPVTTDVMGAPVLSSATRVDASIPTFNADGHLVPSDHPFFGQTQFAAKWVGARSTLQRWFADPVVNVQGVDRGLGIIFTHDHYGPSTHQQIGLYATVLIEPAGSKWLHNETGQQLYTRTGGAPAMNDGGPTSWQAAILTGDQGIGGYSQNVKAEQIEPYREFYFEYTDFQHAYQPDTWVGIRYDENFNWIPVEGEYHPVDANGDGIIDNPRTGALYTDTFRDAIQPPVRKQASVKGGTVTGYDEHGEAIVDGGFPVDIWEFPGYCKGSDPTNGIIVPRPCPEAITADDPGMYVVNYRNESLLARIYDPNKPGPDANGNDCSDPLNRTGCGAQADGRAGDLAFAMDTNTRRAIDALNKVEGLAPATYFDSTPCSNGAGGTVFCPPINDPAALAGGDPFTPMVRVMDGDNVKVKMQAGGQEEEHTANIHGLKWLQGGSGFGESKNSGWRNAQAGGISEQFTLRMPIYADYGQRGNMADYYYTFNPSTDGWASGVWGIVRSYKGGQDKGLYQLDNPITSGFSANNSNDFNGVCPKSAAVVAYDITAVQANDVLGSLPGITIQDLFGATTHVGAAPDQNGGTLVYNPRDNAVADVVTPDGDVVRGGVGPLHDPTAIIYVHTKDLVAVDGHGHQILEMKVEGKRGKGGWTYEAWDKDSYGNYAKVHDMGSADWGAVHSACYTAGTTLKYHPFTSGCPSKLRHDVPVEPLVFRAAAGNCIDVTLRNQVLQPGTIQDVYGNPTRVYRNGEVNSPAFYYVQGQDIRADLNGDGVMEPVDGTQVNWDQTLDLANGNPMIAAVRRDPGVAGDPLSGLTSFNNNLIQPSAYVGLKPQLVEFDVTRSAGVNIGQNPATQAVMPGGMQTYKWYAGNVGFTAEMGKGNKMGQTFAGTPIEFGGFNVMPTDPIEQGQKGLVAAGVIYPEGSTWTVDAGGNTSATVTRSSLEAGSLGAVGLKPSFRDFTTVASKGLSMYFADSYPIPNILGEGEFAVGEDAQDMGHMAINYGNEAMWFRFGRNPAAAAGNADCNGLGANACLGGVANAHQAFSNTLTGGDPETAVFTVKAGDEYRMHVLMPFGPGRGSTYDLHGAVFLRDPYVCQGENDLTLPGKCDMTTRGGLPGGSAGSRSIGNNPVGFRLGGIESWFPGEHYEIFIPSAGGSFAVPGDYLFRDHMGLGNTGGLWGIVRVGGGD